MTIKHLSAGIVTFRKVNGKFYFLLLKYPQGHIEFPKGHLEANDKDIKQAAIRELEEETGVTDPRFLDGFYQEIEYEYEEDQQKHFKKVCFFLAEVFDDQLSISHEHTEIFWAEYDEALKLVTFENARSLLLNAKTLIDLHELSS